MILWSKADTKVIDSFFLNYDTFLSLTPVKQLYHLLHWLYISVLENVNKSPRGHFDGDSADTF